MGLLIHITYFFYADSCVALQVSYACPWAHRTIITRKLRGLDDLVGTQNMISSTFVPLACLLRPNTRLFQLELMPSIFFHPGVTIVSPHMGSLGWPFASADEFPAAETDPLYNSKHIRDLYFRAQSDYQGR
jgi:putative glutathione S-transferase